MITKYLKIDSEKEQQLLTFIESSENKGHERKRGLAILMSVNQTTVNQIAEKLKKNPDTIYDWLIKYTEKGIEGLKDRPKSGRPRKLKKEDEISIKEIFKK